MISEEICTSNKRPGDRFAIRLERDVAGEGGMRLAAGTPVLVELAQIPPDGGFEFRVKSVEVDGQLVPIAGRVDTDGQSTQRRTASKGSDIGKVAAGAAAGAILGRVLGGGKKGAVVGAAAGGAAGTIAASRNSAEEHCLMSGARLTVTLSSPLVLTTGDP